MKYFVYSNGVIYSIDEYGNSNFHGEYAVINGVFNELDCDGQIVDHFKLYPTLSDLAHALEGK